MTKTEIVETQKRVGTEPDGFWGASSTAAAKRHLKRIAPANNPFPTQRQVQSNTSVYGPHGEKNGYEPPSKKIKLPFALHLYGDSSKLVKTLSVHPFCADSLQMIFEDLANVYTTTDERKAAGILDYYGVYNPRSIRGGSVWSMHAYRIAIDLDANRNRNRAHWPTASKMPIRVMEVFASHGWLCAGAMWSRDSMHFQSTKS
jgi:hypothetical protein